MLYTTVVAAAWNAGGGEEKGGPTDAQVVDVLTKIFKPEKFNAKWKARLFMGCEFQEKHDRRVIHDLGLEMHRFGRECILAWDPKELRALSISDVRLNPTTPYFRKGGSAPVYCDAPAALLGTQHGLVVDALSLHLPSSVQERNAPPNRVKAGVEAAEVMADRHKSNYAHAVDYAGDFNIDPAGGFGPWPVMQKKVTGLEVLVAPRNTLGRRKVDHHAVRGFKDEGGQVITGPTHHNAHLRRLTFKAA